MKQWGWKGKIGCGYSHRNESRNSDERFLGISAILVWCEQAATPLENYEGTNPCETNSSWLKHGRKQGKEIEDERTISDLDKDTYMD